MVATAARSAFPLLKAMHFSLRAKSIVGILLIQAALGLLWLWLSSDPSGVAYAGPDSSPTATGSTLSHFATLVASAVVAAFALGSWLTRSVTELRRGAALLKNGRYGVQIPVRGSDEVADTAVALNNVSRRMAELSSEAERSEARFTYLSGHDPLTGLMNRRRFQTELEKWTHHATRYRRPVSLLLLDLDHFKFINDSLGHRAGDRLLARLATLLLEETRETDVVARLGGDEFGILLTESDAEGAAAVARRALDRLAQSDVEINSRLLYTTGSIGIASCPRHGTDVETLLTRADMAMYRAKDSGRNRVHVFHDEDERLGQVQSMVRWEDQIKRALREDRFALFRQPILGLGVDAVEHYEVLLRMHDGDNGWIAPGAFLDTAERFGLIEDIDRRVVRLACEQQVAARAVGHDVHLSVNLSGYEFNNLAMCHGIQDTIRETGADPTRLMFEITETRALANVVEAGRFIRELTDIGCRFALDDFGAGFTSLSYLKEIPVSVIKIDGSFVRHLDRSSRDQALVRAVTDMAHAMGMEVTAEFVESGETLALLRNIGVDHAQGFFIGRPQEMTVT
jgi:diguanylate cyclase (GGDEF)-like protein